MKLFIEIGSAVNVVINLSEDGVNKVAIQGGGNLIYSMNPEGGNNLDVYKRQAGNCVDG